MLALLLAAPLGTVAPAKVSALPQFAAFIRAKQAALIAELEAADGGASFVLEERPDGSGGMAVIEGGDLIEKGGIGVTVMDGVLTEQRASAMSSRGREVAAGSRYSAAALSLVLHAASPRVPTFRSDVRIFEVERPDGSTASWVGGGADLTPSYLVEEDATAFHTFWRAVCEKHECADYGRFKAWCDEYFYIPSRGETRGLGGIFFDDLDAPGAVAFARDVADGFMPSWLPIVDRRRGEAYGEEERQWQLLRRGRYLEFNLLYDRGVRFGLEGGPSRVENLMVSAPPLIAWGYKKEPPPGTDEARLMAVLREPREWA